MSTTPVKSDAVVRDGLKIQPLRLDEASVKGLMPIQIEAMRETAIDVNNAMAVAGNATRSAMTMLAMLKRNIGYSNWTAFINSGVLSVSSKIAADYVNAYEKWLKADEDVTDVVIGSLSARSLVAIANAQQTTRTIVKAKILAGATSELDIRNAIKAAEGKPSKAKDKTTEKRVDQVRDKLKEITSKVDANSSVDELLNTIKALKDMNSEIITNNNAFRQENKSMEAKVAKLEEQIKQMKLAA